MKMNLLTRGALTAFIALSSATIARAELTHRYSFKDGAKDSVGKADGTLKGNAKAADGKLDLNNGEKTSGDADVSYVDIAGPILPKKGSATVMVWFSAKDAAQFSRLLDIGSKSDDGGSAFVYLTARTGDDGSRGAISATDAASKSAVDGDRLDDAKPHMLALVIDSGDKKIHLYADGKEVGTAADLGDNTLDKVNQDHAWIGRSAFDSDGALSGTINELRIYDEALTPDQIKAAAAAGADTLPAK